MQFLFTTDNCFTPFESLELWAVDSLGWLKLMGVALLAFTGCLAESFTGVRP